MTQVNGTKNAIMQVMHFLNGPMVNLLLICWKWLLKGNWATILHYPWIPNYLEHFSVSVLLMELPKMLKNSCIFKTFSFQTFYEAKVIIQSLPTKQKVPASLEQIFSEGDSQEYLGIWKWSFGLLKMKLSMFHLAPTRNMLAGIFVKWARFLAVLREHIFYHVEWVEVHKMSDVFSAKLYRKMSDLCC